MESWNVGTLKSGKVEGMEGWKVGRLDRLKV